MKLHLKNKHLTRFLAKTLGIPGYKFEFVFVRETYDEDLLESTFYRQTIKEFDEAVAEYKALMVKELGDTRD